MKSRAETTVSVETRSDLNQRILVVDDDSVIRRLYSKALTRSGYQVDTAEDGDAGWKVLHRASAAPDSYDLLITDYNMPKLSGVGLVKKLRSANMTLPVIIVSGTHPLFTEQLHLTAILSKPLSSAQLVQKVKEVLHTGTRVVEESAGFTKTQ